jgi:hypothetical protein
MISIIMGICSSRPDNVAIITKTKNDYELVIKSSKELEHLLDRQFGATGKGLHEKADSVEQYFGKVGRRGSVRSLYKCFNSTVLIVRSSSFYFFHCACMQDLIRQIHYLATIRNKLVHEYDFNSIPDRTAFIAKFVSAEKELRAILKKHGKGGSSSGGCTVM